MYRYNYSRRRRADIQNSGVWHSYIQAGNSCVSGVQCNADDAKQKSCWQKFEILYCEMDHDTVITGRRSILKEPEERRRVHSDVAAINTVNTSSVCRMQS